MIRTVTGVLALLFATALSAQPLYVNDFESGDVAGWTTTVLDPSYQRVVGIAIAPNASTRFLGDFGNQSVTYTTTGLPLHDSVIIELDLYVIRTWDGNAIDENGPDVFSISDGNRGTITRTTFAGDVERAQAFPGAYPGASYAGLTGAFSVGSLGYDNGGDAVYRLRIAYPHTQSILVLTFAAQLRDRFPTLENESWGIDNIAISVTTPTPASASLHVGSAVGAPDDRVFVPIVIRDAVSVHASGATSIRAQLRFNGSMLMPESPTPIGRMEGRDRVIDVDLPLDIAGDSTIATFNFRVKVGDDTVTTITLESFTAVGGDIALSARSGTFRVRGLCYDGGTRLFRSEASTLLRAPLPNPARDRTTITFDAAGTEHVRIELISAEGAPVRVLHDGVSSGGTMSLDTDGLSSGRYIVRMHAGYRRSEQVLFIVR